MPASRGNLLLLHAVLLCSGFAGLGYQMAWTRMLSVSLGHEYIAMLAVLAAFFVGLALGGLCLNRRLRETPHPGRWYIGLELLIGLWALALVVLLPALNTAIPQWIDTDPGPLRHWGIAFGISLMALLPATAAMGATLPGVERLALARTPGHQAMPGLYAANTAGAMLGTLLATFFLLPWLGLEHTLLLFAAVNFAVAAAVLPHARRAAPAAPAQRQTASDPVGTDAPGILPLLFLTGLLGIGFEVLVVRVLAQVLEGTVYSFAAVLTVYLLGTALGAALYQRRLDRAGEGDDWARLATTLLFATASCCLLGSAVLWLTDTIYRGIFDLLGPGDLTGLVAELAVAASVFLLPTVCMGALFSHLAQRGKQVHGLGLVLGINTLGGALAPLLFGVLALPLLGAKLALLALCAAYLLLPLAGLARAARWPLAVPGVLALLAILFAPLPLRFVPTQDGSQVLAYREGVVAAVAVIEEPDGNRHLAVNNHFIMGGTASRFSDHRQTHLPLLWHGEARSVLYLGLGTGITLQASKYHPQLAVTGVELVPEMLSLMPLFDVDVKGADWRQPPRLLAADARRFVTADSGSYDVIIAEVFHPSRDGAGSLYTVEHFRAVRERLANDGLFCQWLPLFQLELDTLQLITRSFLEVFPDAQMHLAHFSLGQPLLCLLGRRGDNRFQDDWLLERVHDRTLQAQLVQLHLNSDFALFGGYLGGARALRAFAGEGPLNTDDNPRVTYSAPSFVYGTPAAPAARLLQLNAALAPLRGSLLPERESQSDFDARLRAYWRARDAFLAAGVGIRPSADVAAMLQQVREPLLEVVRMSPDFLPAYEPLLQMARSLAASNPRAALDLLQDLEQANPEAPWARRLQQQILAR
ncbi:fused MFS/spermidine synthase [Mangrovimicrobium sediminis]|uniref:fused MFS/spermidine synthase n=1 Tax=Mangrovimicrobium sediminis TaxID=2562682 RepID=UPI0010805313|nr:fused MFS/spermidine synthase [Haliea sp. SAOS-164]